MKRTTTILSIVTLTLVGVGLFHVAQNVRDYEGQLKTLATKIDHEKETIHTLRAEWVFLNQPDRLEKLAKKHTDLEAICEKNLLALSVVPSLAIEQETTELENEKKEKITAQHDQVAGYDSYVSKVSKKTSSTLEQPTLPVQNISLRDIWR